MPRTPKNDLTPISPRLAERIASTYTTYRPNLILMARATLGAYWRYAEDCIQQAVMGMLNKPYLEDVTDGHLRNYLYTCVTNACRDAYRKAQGRSANALEYTQGLLNADLEGPGLSSGHYTEHLALYLPDVAERSDPETMAELRELVDGVTAFLQHDDLPYAYDLFMLTWLGYSYAAIAAILVANDYDLHTTSVGSESTMDNEHIVRMKLYRLRKRLQRHLLQYNLITPRVKKALRRGAIKPEAEVTHVA